MKRLQSIDDFNELKERLVLKHDPIIPTLIITAGTCGQASGANDLIRITKRELLNRGLTNEINYRITGCHGFCEQEPFVLVEPRGTFYPKVNMDDMIRIIEAVKQEQVLKDLLYVDSQTGKTIEKQEDLPFYKKQVRTILASNEKIDPIRIYDYITNQGYVALTTILQQQDSKWV
ncbi:MAG: NADH-quinone oxidoreductase subunit F, partial [Candidatus Marinimicrobia bacterium]|nr:NADH-quinone oxidoreductase subunit F [Candidatus Neomarinimicrobiota bacterium]